MYFRDDAAMQYALTGCIIDYCQKSLLRTQRMEILLLLAKKCRNFLVSWYICKL